MLRGILITLLLSLTARIAVAEDGVLFSQAEQTPETGVRVEPTSLPPHRAVEHINAASGVSIPIQFTAPNNPSKVIFVFVGGLDSDIESFDRVAELLRPFGYGTLQLELNGQGELISKSPIVQNILLTTQSQDLISVIDELRLDKTKIVLVGQSYGAAVAVQAASDILSRDKYNVAAVDLVNPLIPAASISFAPIFMRLKNISGVGPTESRNIRDLLVYLSARGEYASQTDESFDLNEVTAAYELFTGVPTETTMLLTTLNLKVNLFDGLSDLVVSTAEKANLFERLSENSRGIYFKSESAGQRAGEEAPEELAKFLTEAHP